MQDLGELRLGVWSSTRVQRPPFAKVSLFETHDFCLEVNPKPRRKQQALRFPSQQSTSISSTMSNQPEDSLLNPLSTLDKVRFRSPRPRYANDSTGTARSSSAPPIMRTPSSAIRLADPEMAVAGEIPDNPFAHYVDIDPHLIKHCR